MYRQRGYGGCGFFPRTISFLLLLFSSLNFSSWWDSGYWKSVVLNFKQNMNNIAAVQLGASWPCLWFLITNGDRAKFFKYLKVVHHQVQNMVAHNCHSKLPKTSRQKQNTGKNNGFPFLDLLGYLKNTHKNPKFGRVRPSSDVVLLPCRTKFRN